MGLPWCSAGQHSTMLHWCFIWNNSVLPMQLVGGKYVHVREPLSEPCSLFTSVIYSPDLPDLTLYDGT